MQVIGLDGKSYPWNFKRQTKGTFSQYHERARILLKEMFPLMRIYEEVMLPGTGKMNLIADFYIPNEKILVEVHGGQHYKHTPFFHGPRKNFVKGLNRDYSKQRWCELNQIYYVELPYDDESNWKQRLLKRGMDESINTTG